MVSGLAGWHLLILLALVIPFVLAAVSIARNRATTGTAKAVWVLVILLFPLVGAILWFLVGRRSGGDPAGAA
ncbi:PLDc N-terminal domain-containing protein [Microbacterium sp. CJ88]|uniref:PLDc N-terminal domain-containing protein n=1 Tax=Microbacterium sp. CJ88 TaxID=3445672 RepID=UPI003F65F9ED